MTLDESRKKNHPIGIDAFCSTVLWKIMVRPDIGNPPVLDPDRLVLDKFPGKRIEQDAMGKDRIRCDTAQGNITQDFSFPDLFGATCHSKRSTFLMESCSILSLLCIIPCHRLSE